MNFTLNVTEFWHWWILAAVFFALELTAPGAFLLWLGFAATLCGFVFWAFPEITFMNELIIFAGVSFVLLLIWYKSFRGYVPHSAQPHLNDRASALIGSVHLLDHPIAHNLGKIKVNDSYWRVEGPDLKKGIKIKVVDVKDGSTLLVEEVVSSTDAH